MKSTMFFGLGKGHLSQRVARVARMHGSQLVNYTDPGCSCGNGCKSNCPANRRHWFEQHPNCPPGEFFSAVKKSLTQQDRRSASL